MRCAWFFAFFWGVGGDPAGNNRVVLASLRAHFVAIRAFVFAACL